MGVTIGIEIGEIGNRVGRGLVTPRRSGRGVGGPESLQRLQGGAHGTRPGLERGGTRPCYQAKSAAEIRGEPRRRRRSRRLALLPDDHRCWRLQPHPLSTVDSGQHFVARRSCGQTFKFGEEEIGERLSSVCRPALELSVQRVRHIANLDHLGHVMSMLTCCSHVKSRASRDRWNRVRMRRGSDLSVAISSPYSSRSSLPSPASRRRCRGCRPGARARRAPCTCRCLS